MKYKFKGYSTEDNSWKHGSLIEFENGNCSIMVTNKNSIGGISYPVDPDSVCIMSPYGDNDNVEIYQGDIVQTYCYDALHTHTVEFSLDRGFTAGSYQLNSVYFCGGGSSFKNLGPSYEPACS